MIINPPMPDQKEKLRVELLNKEPIELIALTNSLLSLGNQYKRFCDRHGNSGQYYEARLYINEIKSGSVITDLISMSPFVALPFIENANTIFEFGNYLKTAFDKFRGGSSFDLKLDKKDYEDLSCILEPVARDNGAQYNILNTGAGNVYVNIFSTNSIEAKQMQRRINAERNKKSDSDSNSYEKEIFYWYQARKGAPSKNGDLGIIESISNKPLKVLFDTETIKMALVDGVRNPFKMAFVVDVQLKTIDEKPIAYKITRVYESFPKG
jgi:hypothetical protein